MKRTQEHKPNEATKRLFRNLFEVQYRLERFNTNLNDPGISVIVEEIDQILEKMLECYED